MNKSDKRKNPSRGLLSTAYHEAGHAYAQFRFKIPLESVSIIPGGGYLGITRSASSDDVSVISGSPSLEEIQRWENEIIVFFAGRVSALYFGFSGNWNQAEADKNAIGALLIALYPNPVTAGRAAQFYESCANDIVAGPNGKICIPFLAEELIARRELTGEEAIKAFNLALRKAAGTK